MSLDQASTSASSVQEYTVRCPRNVRKRYSILQFNANNKVDFTKESTAKIERENNLKEYKLSHNVDQMPKYGAGSEFGREQKEEARRKKFGINKKKYNPDDQPWHIKLGSGKQCRRFKGIKNGGVMENSTFYIFTQCADGAFDAFPLRDWHNFTPIVKYKCLNSEEAEEEYTRRDKTMNYFSVMLKKRLKNEDDADDDGPAEKTKGKAKAKKKGKDFMLTEIDEWAMYSDGDSEDEEDDIDGDDGDKKEKKTKKGKGGKKKRVPRGGKTNSDDEAVEESDDADEGQEIDYMSDSESNDEGMYEEKQRDEMKYDDKGVEDEKGLRKLVESGDEDEEDEENKEKDEEKDAEDKNGKKNGSESDSSSSSGSESDPEDDGEIKSALFMQKSDKPEKKKGRRNSHSSEGSAPNSRSGTPTNAEPGKRKRDTDSPLLKKIKTEPSLSSMGSGTNEGITEDAVRRYLMRKPMRTKDLLQKFRSKNAKMDKSQIVHTIVNILKRINPETNKIKGELYLSLKKTD